MTLFATNDARSHKTELGDVLYQIFGQFPRVCDLICSQYRVGKIKMDPDDAETPGTAKGGHLLRFADCAAPACRNLP